MIKWWDAYTSDIAPWGKNVYLLALWWSLPIFKLFYQESQVSYLGNSEYLIPQCQDIFLIQLHVVPSDLSPIRW